MGVWTGRGSKVAVAKAGTAVDIWGEGGNEVAGGANAVADTAPQPVRANIASKPRTMAIRPGIFVILGGGR